MTELLINPFNNFIKLPCLHTLTSQCNVQRVKVTPVHGVSTWHRGRVSKHALNTGNDKPASVRAAGVFNYESKRELNT